MSTPRRRLALGDLHELAVLVAAARELRLKLRDPSSKKLTAELDEPGWRQAMDLSPRDVADVAPPGDVTQDDTSTVEKTLDELLDELVKQRTAADGGPKAQDNLKRYVGPKAQNNLEGIHP